MSQAGRFSHARLPRRLAVAAAASLATFAVCAPAAGAAPGDIDNVFGPAGLVELDSGGNERAHAVAVQPDGKILVAGATSVGGNGVIYRVDANGARDATFDFDGAVAIDSGGNEVINAIAVQPNGKILVAGGTTVNNNIAVYRLNPDGTFDRTFDADGAVGLDSGGNEVANDIAIQPNGKIIVGGLTNVNNNAVVWRLHETGAIDTSFDTDGAVGIDSGGIEVANAVGVQPDGRIVVAGYTSVNNNAAIYRLTQNGALDGTFDGDGALGIDSGGTETAFDLAIQPDGKFVLAGSTTVGQNALIYRVNPNGALDNTFDGDGALGLDYGNSEVAAATVVQPDGKIVLAGSTTAGADALVFRLNADGSRDSTFDGDGAVAVGTGGFNRADDVALQSDGNIVIAGTNSSTATNAVVARLVGTQPVQRPQDPDRPEDPRPEDPKPRPLTCAGKRATIVGTNRSERIKGTQGRDVIVALGGNDRIEGLAGNDVVCAGDGNDTAKGGRGRDQVYGQNGRDKLYGDAEADRLVGGTGNDRLLGGKGRDKLVGGAGKDVARQ